MDGSLEFPADDRKSVLRLYRTGSGVVSRQAQVPLFIADWWSVRDIRGATFTSIDFITQTLRRIRDQGLDCLFADGLPRPMPSWAKQVAKWVTTCTPSDFGYFRRRWSYETLAEALAWEADVRVRAETVRRVMRRHRSVRRIHLICDDAAFHKGRSVREYLREWGHRIVLHFMPRFAPETTPIERIW